MKARPYFIAALIGAGGLMLSGCVEGGYYDSYDGYGPGGYYSDYGGGPYVYNDVVVSHPYRGHRYYGHRDYGHRDYGHWNNNGHRDNGHHDNGHRDYGHRNAGSSYRGSSHEYRGDPGRGQSHLTGRSNSGMGGHGRSDNAPNYQQQ